jgi:CubicO group peptidase (beta-lactamase class C family)
VLFSNAQSLPGIDDSVHAFMQHYHVPGIAVVVTRNGEIVYAKGYGYADTSLKTAVTPNSLFRLASVSKPITATAILKLVEEKKLTLNDRVFGPGAVLGTQYGHPPYATGVQQITIRELLQHTSGGWTNNFTDPMFHHPEMTAEELISWTLDHQGLTNQPGKVFAYSNFGYCILGRVIEKLTGMPYDAAVKKLILTPAGISSMQIGGNTREQRKPGEVIYYGQNNEDPYMYNISRMDAHGGWIASAIDMARFLLHVDGFPNPPDVLRDSSITAMTTGSAANPGYALGWGVNAYQNWWHAGSLPGTATEIIRAKKGFNWVILCNTRSNGAFFNDLDGLLWSAVNDPKTPWPRRVKL